ncbi:MAG TPA: NADH-quinone oxidoreductase subunit A [Gemmatimonadota bacterium]|jgi:NADH-quinone oxidoreductase subunit A
MLSEYIPVVFLLFTGLLVGAVIVILSWFMGPRTRPLSIGDSPYECGLVPTGDARQRVNVKFFLIAMLFILFDVEIVFLFPWAIMFDSLGGLGILVMVEFFVVLLVGYAYVWRKGALEWS